MRLVKRVRILGHDVPGHPAIAVAHLPPMLFAGIRFVIAGTFFIAFLEMAGQTAAEGQRFCSSGGGRSILVGDCKRIGGVGGAMDSERIDRPLIYNCALLHGWIGISIAEGLRS